MSNVGPSYKETVSHILGKYEYKRGPQARTVIRQMRKNNFTDISAENVYPKTIEILWQGITLTNPIYELSVIHGEDCHRINCKCTPIPKDVRSVASDDKRRRKREDKHHLRGRPFAHIQTEEAV